MKMLMHDISYFLFFSRRKISILAVLSKAVVVPIPNWSTKSALLTRQPRRWQLKM